MTTTIFIFRAPKELGSKVIETFKTSGDLIKSCDLIVTGTPFVHTKTGHVIGERTKPAKFIATSELDLHPKLNSLQPMQDQQKWFQEIPAAKTALLWAETIKISTAIRKICNGHPGKTIIFIVDDRIVDAVSAVIRCEKIGDLNSLAKVQQQHLDKIAVKLTFDGDEITEELGITEGDLLKPKMTLVDPVNLPRWPGDGNPVW